MCLHVFGVGVGVDDDEVRVEGFRARVCESSVKQSGKSIAESVWWEMKTEWQNEGIEKESEVVGRGRGGCLRHT